MSHVLARLLVEEGPSPGEEYALSEEKVIIGRAANNDIVISDAEVSRQHAEIIPQQRAGQHLDQPMGYTINDLGSTNGTFVNGERVVTATALNHGDLIELGEAISLTFLSDAPTDSPSLVQPIPPAAASHAVPQLSPPPPDAHPWDEHEASSKTGSNRFRWTIGCGCGCLLIVFICMATLFFLDAYDQGRLLYCGPLQPLFETILGPVGFSPACALP